MSLRQLKGLNQDTTALSDSLGTPKRKSEDYELAIQNINKFLSSTRNFQDKDHKFKLLKAIE